MRRYGKRVLCALLALGMLAASGCAGKEKNPAQTTGTEQEQTTGTGEQTTDAPWDPETEGGIVDMSHAVYTYDAMEEDLAQLAAAYPSYFSYRSIGKSREGREIYAAVLGDHGSRFPLWLP